MEWFAELRIGPGYHPGRTAYRRKRRGGARLPALLEVLDGFIVPPEIAVEVFEVVSNSVNSSGEVVDVDPLPDHSGENGSEKDEELRVAHGSHCISPMRLVAAEVSITKYRLFVNKKVGFMASNFEFGKHVRDAVTGFRGVVTGGAEFMDGRKMAFVEPLTSTTGALVGEAQWIETSRIVDNGPIPGSRSLST